jgi:hypothetical protein
MEEFIKENENMFKKLNAINVNDKTEEKNGLTYLSWAWAWGEFKKNYPEATYTIKRNENGLPYIYDENLGYMVFTEVRVGMLTHEMWLPVMDGANKTMKKEPYTYQTKEYKFGKWTGNYVEKTVEPATMFDINKTLMRCLVKNLAMFGLGLYIYAGEDLPEEVAEETKLISKVQETALRDMIKNKKIPNEIIINMLKEKGYEKIAEIQIKDYMLFVEQIEKINVIEG